MIVDFALFIGYVVIALSSLVAVTIAGYVATDFVFTKVTMAMGGIRTVLAVKRELERRNRGEG